MKTLSLVVLFLVGVELTAHADEPRTGFFAGGARQQGDGIRVLIGDGLDKAGRPTGVTEFVLVKGCYDESRFRERLAPAVGAWVDFTGDALNPGCVTSLVPIDGRTATVTTADLEVPCRGITLDATATQF